MIRYLDILKVGNPCFCSGSLVGELLHLLLDCVHRSEKGQILFDVSIIRIAQIWNTSILDEIS